MILSVEGLITLTSTSWTEGVHRLISIIVFSSLLISSFCVGWFVHRSVRSPPPDRCLKQFMKVCEEMADGWNKQDHIRTDVDDRNDSVGKRIRDAEKEWIPYIMVIGEKDLNQAEPSFTVRVRKTNEEESMPVWQINQAIQSQIKGKPYSSLNAPMLLSKRPVIQV